MPYYCREIRNPRLWRAAPPTYVQGGLLKLYTNSDLLVAPEYEVSLIQGLAECLLQTARIKAKS